MRLFGCFLIPVALLAPVREPNKAEAADLLAAVAVAPRVAVSRNELKLQPPSPGWKIGYPSSVAMDNDGTIYVLQRDDTADPIIAISRDGHILRSWGKGLFKIPHAIRIDKQGRVWTVDAGNSMVYKFTAKGEKLLEISVGEQPAGKTAFTGATDIAFAPNGHLYISDGYGNARILECTAEGKRVRQWGSEGSGPGQFRQPHGIAIDDQGIVYVADHVRDSRRRSISALYNRNDRHESDNIRNSTCA